MKNLKVLGLEGEPAVLAAVAAKISRTPLEDATIEDIFKDCKEGPEKSKKLVGRVLNYGHMIPSDFGGFAIGLENISRLAAIYIWRNVNTANSIFGAGIEASLRLIKVNRFNDTIDPKIGNEFFEAYEKIIDLGIPVQDARYVLPEATLTRMIFSAPPRYLIKLANSLRATPLDELQEIGNKIKELVEDYFLKIPEEEAISNWSFWGKEESTKDKISLDYRNNIHSLSLNMNVEGSLSMYAQLVRQRQLLCLIEPFEAIARRKEFVVPPTFNKKAEEIYRAVAEKAINKQLELIDQKDPNFVYFLLLGQKASSQLFGKGKPILHTSQARSEGVAQWEIRTEVGIPLTSKLSQKIPSLNDEIGPHCYRKGFCKEDNTFKTKKASCPAFEKWQGKKPSNLKEALKVLREEYHSFKL
jgi:thymidylate synthase (FAD)